MRLKHAHEGLRKFSDTVKMCPIEYSKIEKGIISPPSDKKWVYEMIDILNLEHKSEEVLKLYESQSMNV